MHDSNRALPFVALLSILAASAWSGAAHARAYQVPCDVAELLWVVQEAGFNGQEDAIWLAPGCLYALNGIVIAYADDGHPLTIHGNGATLSGLDARTLLLVNPGATLHVQDATFTEGRAGATASGDGGAIWNAGALTLSEIDVTNSEALTGGGIFNAEGASLTLVRSSVRGNTAGRDGGGIRNQRGRLTLIDSSVTGNAANGQNGMGGGIYNEDDGLGARAVVSITNSTVSGNASRFGAGLYNGEGRVTVSHGTFVNKPVNGGNGGIYHQNGNGAGSIRLSNSIVAGAQGDGLDCARDPYVVTNPISAVGVNLIEDGSGPVAGALSGNPGLGPLAGLPAHHPLQAGSPAIDAANGAVCPGVDQRGVSRPRDGDGNTTPTCDIGAYEY
jgi:hypothetical protein